ncbi:uncharacterized protein LOC142239671 [Haematobia irritans]|uniref:uncharacterized protein LOC142239671 n=1 Tax=Haematobia irritans TaxID=7368 RepID=UPI003F50B4D8
MVDRKSLSLLAIICKSLLLVKLAHGTRYEFAFDNEDLFEKCPDVPGTKGLHDLFNLDQMEFKYDDGQITVSGNVTIVWKDVQPTDRITAKFELFKFFRGKWQLTPYTVFTSDWCDSLFDETTLWYEIWTQNIVEEDRICVNNHGHTYHHKTFKAAFVLDFYSNLEGRYKCVIQVQAFDGANRARSSQPLCIQVVGEFFKVK